MDYSLLPFFFVLALSFAIGVFFSKRAKKQSDYFLAGRTLSWPLLTMTFAATQIGGGFILGTADAAFQIGPYAFFFPLGYCLGFLGLGAGFGAKLRSLELNTTADLFERYYGSHLLKKGAALLSVISLTGILIAQAVALRAFLFSAGWGEEWIFLLAWMVVILYTTQGGFLAVVWTDTVQAVVMIGMLITAFCFILTTAPSVSFEVATKWPVAEPKILGYLLMPFLFTFIEQDMTQRCFAAKSSSDVSRAGLLSALILLLLAAIPVYFGMLAETLHVEQGPTSKFMEVVKLLTSPKLVSCAASAVLLAIISTASSLLSAVSSNISQDFTSTNAVPLNRTKWITFGIGIFALIGSYTATNILSCMVASYELSVACLFVPFIAAVFMKDRCLTLLPAAVASVAAGAIGFIGVKLFPLGVYGELFPLALSGLGYLGGMIAAKRKKQEMITI
ncbi:MAG: panF [Chlamydiia bacterium]|nr:panF [Chlamydiia bacterium]